MPHLVVAKYRCAVAGTSTDSVDFQVRYFDTDDEEEALKRLRDEAPNGYKNASGELVRWSFECTVATQHDPVFKDGVEIIGFITGEPQGSV